MEKKVKKSLLEIIKNSILKPVNSVEENAASFKDAKMTFIFAGIITVLITVSNLLATMLSTIFSKQYDFWTQKYNWSISFSNLSSLDFSDLIFTRLVQYALIILGIAGIYFLATSILKKNVSYVKILGIVSLAVIPSVILSFCASVLGIIWNPLGLFIEAAAVAYVILILTFSLKNILKIDDVDKLVFYNVVIIVGLKILEYIIFSSGLFN